MRADVVIVGAGPAGASAALWARSLRLVPEVLESTGAAGGQLKLMEARPLDLVGVVGAEGRALGRLIGEQLTAARLDVRYGAAAVALESGGEVNPPRVITADGAVHEGGAVVIASGVRRRRLDVPGETEFEGRGVTYSASRDRALLANRRVVVVGGGDAALEGALLLTDVGCQVTLVMRSLPRARHELLERISNEPRIEIAPAASVTAIRGRDWVSAVRIQSGGQAAEVKADGIVISVGVIPNTEWCKTALELDPEGFIRVDAELRTSRPRVWAAGDVTRPGVPSLALAIGQGAQAVAALRAALRPV